jgi:hypothetical protein
MTPEKQELSREELYELVWSKPMATLALEIGISDVALKKRCLQLSIPTPRRGHWAKLEAGRTVIRTKLPPAIGGAAPQVPISAHHSQWPRDLQGLCPLAQALQTQLELLKPNYQDLHSLEHAHFPKVAVTKPMIESAARLFHAILYSIEGTGIPFRKSRSKYEGAYFEIEGSPLHLSITEETRSPDPLYTTWSQKKKGTGKLTVTFNSNQYNQGWKKTWTQGEDRGLREIVATATQSITEYAVELKNKRAEEAERRRIEHERWQKSEVERKQKNHDQALLDTAHQRETDFLFAVEWEHLHRRALNFITECENRWKTQSSGPTPDQIAWLSWARKTADAWSIWEAGYPDTNRDGHFDPTAVPFGGPYPATRNFRRPPTMPEIKIQSNDPWSSSSSPKKEQYPFWLRQQS